METRNRSTSMPNRARVRRDASLRSRVAAAFQRMANGVTQGAAYARSVRFYRSTGYAWAKALG